MKPTEAEVEGWSEQARRYLHRYRSHPQWDDLLSCAYLGLCRAIQTADWEQVVDRAGYALRAAWNGAQSFLISEENIRRKQNRYGTEVLQPLSWDQLTAEWREGSGGKREPRRADFAPRVVDWIEARRRLAAMPPERRVCLILGCLGGLTRQEIAEETGIPLRRVQYFLADIWVIGPAARGKRQR